MLALRTQPSRLGIGMRIDLIAIRTERFYMTHKEIYNNKQWQNRLCTKFSKGCEWHESGRSVFNFSRGMEVSWSSHCGATIPLSLSGRESFQPTAAAGQKGVGYPGACRCSPGSLDPRLIGSQAHWIPGSLDPWLIGSPAHWSLRRNNSVCHRPMGRKWSN